jgi:SAM-dependent methyltransferase/cytidylate kinase
MLIVITGGASSGIGKGCVASAVGFCLSQKFKVSYQKFEPCLQFDISNSSNDIFGEIVQTTNGKFVDSDVSRFMFWCPDADFSELPDASLGHILEKSLQRVKADSYPVHRIVETASETVFDIVGSQDTDSMKIIEIGGTAGEDEHHLLMQMLFKRFPSKQLLHIHVTTVLQKLDGFYTTKPAQNSLDKLIQKPDLIVVRVPYADFEIQSLESHAISNTAIVSFPPSNNPVFDLLPLIFDFLRGENLVEKQPKKPQLYHIPQKEMKVYHDGGGIDSYSSLDTRIRTWSQGRLRPVWIDIRDEKKPRVTNAIIANEKSHEMPFTTVDCFDICKSSIEHASHPRDPLLRPDWKGSLFEPCGELFEFISEKMDLTSDISHSEVKKGYRGEDFVEMYVKKSKGGELRDHALIDEIILSCLPCPSEIPKMKVLDVGSGYGRFSKILLERGVKEISCVEPSQDMIDYMDEEIKDKINLINQPLETGLIGDDWDLILFNLSLDHVVDVEDALKDASSRITQGGRIIVTVEHPIRTSVTDGVRWTNDDGKKSGRIHDYLTSGSREFSWFGSFKVEVQHRPIQEWFGAIKNSGLNIEHLEELTTEESHGVPRFLFLLLEKNLPRRKIITIDGTSCSGKSTLATVLSQHLGWLCLDSSTFSDDLELEQMISENENNGLVITGRSMGRWVKNPLQRIWLDCDIAIRAERTNASPYEIELRDERDKQNQRLIEPDICSLILDSSKATPEDLANQILNRIS